MYFFYFLAYKTLRALVLLFFSMFFQLFSSKRKFISSQLYLFIKGSGFVHLWRFLWFVHKLTQLFQHIERIYCFIQFFYPIRRIYIWSTTIRIHFITFIIINGQSQRENIYLSSTICLIINLYLIINLNFYIISFWLDYTIFIISLKKNKHYLLFLNEFSTCQITIYDIF